MCLILQSNLFLSWDKNINFLWLNSDGYFSFWLAYLYSELKQYKMNLISPYTLYNKVLILYIETIIIVNLFGWNKCKMLDYTRVGFTLLDKNKIICFLVYLFTILDSKQYFWVYKVNIMFKLDRNLIKIKFIVS